MAITVPVPERQVQEGGFPSVSDKANAGPEAFGGGTGLDQVTAATQGLAKTTGSIFAFEKIRADQIAIQDGTNEVSQAQTEILYGENGVLNREGKNALGTPEEANERWRKVSSKVINGLHTNEQRGAMTRVIQNMGFEMDKRVQQHVAVQMKDYDNKTAISLIQNETNAAALGYVDTERISAAVHRQKVTVQELAQRNGYGDEWAKEKTTEVVSGTHEAVIKQMLADGQDMMASSYLTANKDQIDAKTQAALKAPLREGTLRGAGQRNADEIWSKSGGDFGKAIEQVRKIENSDVRERTEQEVRKMDEDRQRALRGTQDKAYLDAYKTIQQKGLRDPSDIQNSIPPAQWIAMGPEHNRALMRTGTDIPTDGKAYMEFLDLARNPSNLTRLSTADYYSRFRSKFDESDQRHADTIWEAASRGDSKVVIQKSELDNVILETGIIPGYNPKKPNGNQAKAFVSFENAAREEILKWQTAHNKVADPVEKQDILNGLAAKQVFVHNMILPDSPRSAAVLVGDQRGRAYVPIDSIPGPEKSAIENFAKKMGKKVTKDKTQRAYAAVIMGDVDRVKAILAE